MAMNDILMKAVTITGNGEVGFGAEGGFIFGIVTKIEPQGNGIAPLGFDGLVSSGTFAVSTATKTALGLTTGNYVATVEWGKTFENIPITSTGADKPAVTNFGVTTATGLIKKVADGTYTNVKLIAVDATANTCTIKIS